MKTLIFALGFLCLPVSGFSETVAKQYDALRNDFSKASRGVRDSKSPEDRRATVLAMTPFADRLTRLAEQHPADPLVFRILRQAIQCIGTTDSAAQIAWETDGVTFPTGSRQDVAGRIVALLSKHHLESPKLRPLCDRMRYNYRLEFGPFLQTAIDKSPHLEVRAEATYALALFLQDRRHAQQLLAARPGMTKYFNTVMGPSYLPTLKKLNETDLSARIEALLMSVADHYAEVEVHNVPLGQKANSALYALRHLSPGKPAPALAGNDEDGKPLKLSDYRGKIVLLYFWNEY